MSREHLPKQLIGLIGDQSLLQSTAQRLDGLTYGTARISCLSRLRAIRHPR
ncbi:MAG: Mannose-1-phosphate guanylyltransferase (GDP) (EC [uncultured Caballeronia sp.]|nr:MAG: Mannose-1-phosphate guanylyltransferase (GDP) (EC [uncultured Caballeronia sp.]